MIMYKVCPIILNNETAKSTKKCSYPVNIEYPRVDVKKNAKDTVPTKNNKNIILLNPN